MDDILYRILGTWMAVWYGAVRWTWFADKTKYEWAYAPINLATAFISILFIFVSQTIPDFRSTWMLIIAVFLSFRNFYYTIEDIIDWPHSPTKQTIFVIIDIAMLLYCLIYIRR